MSLDRQRLSGQRATTQLVGEVSDTDYDTV